MALMTIHDVSKSYGLHRVLNQVSLVVNADERLGLVGANGVGKSTLLKLVMGQLITDSGSITVETGVRVGYLAQVIAGDDGQTLGHLLDGAAHTVRAMEAELRDLEARMSHLTGAALDDVLNNYSERSEQFERAGGYELDYRIEQVLTGLDVAHLERERQFSTLSGGEKSRVGLALLLLSAPDVLLLDEPTNHLDLAALEWLERYLAAYSGAMLIVSHDRYFLNRVVTGIIEIDEQTRQAKRYNGNYDVYHQAKQQERRKWEQDYQRYIEEVAELQFEAGQTSRRNNNYRPHTDADKFIRNAKIAQHDNTVSKRVRVAEERLKRLEANPVPTPPVPLAFDPKFDPAVLKGRLPLVASRLTKHYGERCVLNEVSFTVGVSSRIVLAGPNGAGKSTLIRLLVGQEQPDQGDISINPGVRLGLLEQETAPTHEGETLFEQFKVGMAYPEQSLKTMLIRSGLFRYDDLDKPVSGLSSGQRRKLQIARLIFGKANLLLLDEPTNDVSFDVLEGLESALHRFPGPVIVASHDRRFMQQFGGEIWELRQGRLIQHLSGYEAYMAARLDGIR